MAAERPPAAPPAASGRYRRFLITSLLLTLTFGALLGAMTLASLTAPWATVPLPAMAVRIAHGHAQVFGFAALFVMGVAYHALPRLKAAPLALPRLAAASYWLQAGGVLAIAVGAFLVAPAASWMRIAGAAGLVLGAAAFALVVDRTLAAGAPSAEGIEPWLRAGCAWLVVASAFALAAAGGAHGLQPAAWDAALYGFVGSWIFGLGQRMLPAFLRLRAAAGGRAAVAAAYQLAVLAWVGVVALSPWLPLPAARAGAGLAVSAAVVAYVARLGIAGRAPLPGERFGERFFDAAFCWLLVWAACVPGWSAAAALAGGDVPLPIADFGRHAFAFGFLTQMIVGVAMRILPALSGATLWSGSWRTATFWLLNGAVAVRGLQVVVALGGPPALWPWVAVSGALGLVAVAAFTVNLAMTLRGAGGAGRGALAGQGVAMSGR